MPSWKRAEMENKVIENDITECKRAEKEIKYLKEYNKNILESSPNPTLVVKGNQIEYVNKSFISTFGKTKNDCISKALKEVMPVEVIPVFEELLQDCGTIKELEIKGRSFSVSSFVVKKAEAEEERQVMITISDITERKKMGEEIRRAAAYTHSLIEASLDPLVIVGSDGKITDVNEATENVTGRTREELVGSDFSEYFTEPAKAKEDYEQVFEKGTVRDYPLEIRHKNGSIISVLYNASVYKDESGKVIGVFAVVRDVTEQKKAEDELREADKMLRIVNKELERKVKARTAEIERLLKQKDDFINQLGHDLKTPLTPLTILLPIVKKRVDDPKLKEILDVTIENTDYMKNLVIKTLQLTRLDTPGTTFEIDEATDLSGELNKVIKSNKLILEKKDIKLENKIDEKIIVRADKLRLSELFDNLITNAVKFTPDAGTITFDAKEDKDFVTVSVKDTGIGMTQEQIDHIFDEFYKADESRHRHDFDSSGLGLSICKRIVEKHGGKIWAKSFGEGKGSIFYFTLKRGRQENHVENNKNYRGG